MSQPKSPPPRVLDRATGAVVVERLELAAGYWSRLRGLQLRPRPPRGYGLLLLPSSSIHTFAMRFAIDAAMIDRSGRVLEVRRAVPPWRVVLPTSKPVAILEIPSEADPRQIEPGMQLRVELSGTTRGRACRRYPGLF